MLLFIELDHHYYHTLQYQQSVLINVDTGIKLLFFIIMIFIYEHIDIANFIQYGSRQLDFNGHAQDIMTF